jgi:hypothetical protein
MSDRQLERAKKLTWVAIAMAVVVAVPAAFLPEPCRAFLIGVAVGILAFTATPFMRLTRKHVAKEIFFVVLLVVCIVGPMTAMLSSRGWFLLGFFVGGFTGIGLTLSNLFWKPQQ